jgi:protein subunit release factor A
MLEKLEDIRRRYEEIKERLSDPTFVSDHRAVRDAQKTLAEFEPIIQRIERRRIDRELARPRADRAARRRALPGRNCRAGGPEQLSRVDGN